MPSLYLKGNLISSAYPCCAVHMFIYIYLLEASKPTNSPAVSFLSGPPGAYLGFFRPLGGLNIAGRLLFRTSPSQPRALAVPGFP